MRPLPTAHLVLLAALALLSTPWSSSGQSFYDASGLLPPYISDNALGASVVDVNADGRVDLYRKNRLYLQEADGTFTDAFEEMGYELRGNGSFGALFADADNDGFVETFFMDVDANLPFYLGRNGVRFREYSNDSGIRTIDNVQGSVWTDFNLDGLLDLFVGIDGALPRLYRNVGLDFFQNVAATSGFEEKLAYGAAAADYDQDGDPDIMLTQCAALSGDTLLENVLFRNTGGMFENVSAALGIVDDLPSWGIVWLDYDNDGRLDFYVGNTDHRPTGEPGNSKLYRNLGEAGFEDVTAAAGADHGPASQTIAVAAADFDNDGWVDLFVTDFKELEPALYHNNADGTFTDIWASLGLPTIHSSAVAVGDVDGDGWIDIFQPSIGSDQLLMNLGGENHYLIVALRGQTSNHFGVGGRIDLYAGGLHQVREITAGDGMTSQNHDLSAHFGLGSETAVDSIVVHWPSGSVDNMQNVTVDRKITIVENLGLNDSPSPFSLLSPLRKSVVSNGRQTLTFTWSPASDDDDPVVYALHLEGADLDTTVADLSTESAELERTLFEGGETYRWNVTATDGHSVRAARYAEFVYGPTTAVEPTRDLPTGVVDLAIYPNPFTAATAIHLDMAISTEVVVDVFDALGRRVSRLNDRTIGPGDHRFRWAPIGAASGTYMLRVRVGSATISRSIVKR